MSQRIINIGSGPNTKDGDTVRQAFNLTNQNFTELYSLIGQPVDGNLTTDIVGSVFANDSTLLVDGINGKVYTDRLTNGSAELVLTVGGGNNPYVTFPAFEGGQLFVQSSEIGALSGVAVLSSATNAVQIRPDASNSFTTWLFDTDGSLTSPNNLTITDSGDISYIGKTITEGSDALVGRIHIAAGDVRLEGYSDPDGANNTEIGSVRVAPGAVRLEISQEVVGSTAFSRLDIAPTGMALSSSDGVTTNTYLFDGNTLVLPNNGIIQHLQSFTRVTNGTIDPATPSVVWTGVLDSVTSVKLNIQVEGSETGDDTGWHIQGCEAVIVARWWGSGGVTTPQMSVFGIVYSSVAPLVTFTVQRNIITNLIEVVATPTATANQLEPLYSKIYSVEMNTND